MAQNRVFLKRHKEEVHTGIKYLCDFCEFSATNKANLMDHKACKHEMKDTLVISVVIFRQRKQL